MHRERLPARSLAAWSLVALSISIGHLLIDCTNVHRPCTWSSQSKKMCRPIWRWLLLSVWCGTVYIVRTWVHNPIRLNMTKIDCTLSAPIHAHRWIQWLSGERCSVRSRAHHTTPSNVEPVIFIPYLVFIAGGRTFYSFVYIVGSSLCSTDIVIGRWYNR